MTEVRGVSTEQLVRSLARQNHLDVLPGHLRQQPRRENRGIAQWLSERLGNDVECATERLVVCGHHMMDGRDVVGYCFRIQTLVIAAFHESDRIGVDALPGHAARRGRDEQG